MSYFFQSGDITANNSLYQSMVGRTIPQQKMSEFSVTFGLFNFDHFNVCKNRFDLHTMIIELHAARERTTIV